MPYQTNERVLDNGYEIVEQIGGGGYCTVFKAKNLRVPNQRICVIKRLKIEHIKGEGERMFRREAQILDSLRRGRGVIGPFPELMETHDFDHVMEYIPGKTLAEEVNDLGYKSNEERIQYVEQLLLSLLKTVKLLHSYGVLHRDIKPDNIIRCDNDSRNLLYLIDFGAAKFHNSDSSFFSENLTTILTREYCPPEQEHGLASESLDLYACGKTAVFALTGKTPSEWRDSDQWKAPQWLAGTNLLKVILNLTKGSAQSRTKSASVAIAQLEFPGGSSASDSVSVSIPKVNYRLEYSANNLPGTALAVINCLNEQRINIRRVFIGATQFIEDVPDGSRAIFKIEANSVVDKVKYGLELEERVKAALKEHLISSRFHDLDYSEIFVSIRPINQTRRFHFSIQTSQIDRVGAVSELLDSLQKLKFNNCQIGIAAFLLFPVYAKRKDGYEKLEQSIIDLRCYIDDFHIYDVLSSSGQLNLCSQVLHSVSDSIRKLKGFRNWSVASTNPIIAPISGENEVSIDDAEMDDNLLRWRLEYKTTNAPGIARSIIKTLKENNINIRRAFIGETGVGTDGFIRSSTSRGRFTIVPQDADFSMEQRELKKRIEDSILNQYRSLYAPSEANQLAEAEKNSYYSAPRVEINDADKFNSFYFSAQVIISKDCNAMKLTKAIRYICSIIYNLEGLVWPAKLGESFSVNSINVDRLSCFSCFIPINDSDIGKKIIDMRFSFADNWTKSGDVTKNIIAKTIRDWFMVKIFKLDCVDSVACKAISPQVPVLVKNKMRS